jgi:UDP-N-acetylmuramate-alanine ligase
MLTTVLRECGADPGYVIGGILTETGLGAEDGSGLDFVAEADESDGSFLLLSPDLAIITNIEADHLDNYGSLADIQAAFTTFGLRVSGMVLTCADDPGAEAVAARLDPARVRRYGYPARRLPAHRRGVPRDGDQLHRGGRPAVRSVKSSPR